MADNELPFWCSSSYQFNNIHLDEIFNVIIYLYYSLDTGVDFLKKYGLYLLDTQTEESCLCG